MKSVLIGEISRCPGWLEGKPAHSGPSVSHDWAQTFDISALLVMLLWSESEITPLHLNIRDGNKKSWEINMAFENTGTLNE